MIDIFTREDMENISLYVFHRDYFMVGERVRFLFMSELLQANEWACDNSRMNKNRIREPTMM